MMTEPQPHPLDLLNQKLSTHFVLSDDDRATVCRLPFRIRDVDAAAYLVREGDQTEQRG